MLYLITYCKSVDIGGLDRGGGGGVGLSLAFRPLNSPSRLLTPSFLLGAARKIFLFFPPSVFAQFLLVTGCNSTTKLFGRMGVTRHRKIPIENKSCAGLWAITKLLSTLPPPALSSPSSLPLFSCIPNRTHISKLVFYPKKETQCEWICLVKFIPP